MSENECCRCGRELPEVVHDPETGEDDLDYGTSVLGDQHCSRCFDSLLMEMDPKYQDKQKPIEVLVLSLEDEVTGRFYFDTREEVEAFARTYQPECREDAAGGMIIATRVN